MKHIAYNLDEAEDVAENTKGGHVLVFFVGINDIE